MKYVLNYLLLNVLCESNMCMCECVGTSSLSSPVCMQAHFESNFITSKQPNKQVNGVNSS